MDCYVDKHILSKVFFFKTKQGIRNKLFGSLFFFDLVIPAHLPNKIRQLFVLNEHLAKILDSAQETFKGTHVLIPMFMHVTHVWRVLERLAVDIVVAHVGLQTGHDSFVGLGRAHRVRVGIEEEGGGGDRVVMECVGALEIMLRCCCVHHSHIHL